MIDSEYILDMIVVVLQITERVEGVLYNSESESCSVVSDSVTPRTIQSMEFSRLEYWIG